MEKSKSKLFHTAVSQPCIFAVEAGLAQLLLSWGVEPAAVVGHSIGEIAAAFVVGALSLEESVRLVVLRGQCMEHALEGGAMVAAEVSLNRANEIIISCGVENVNVGAWNSPTSVSFSGDSKEMESVVEILKKDDVFYRKLDVQSAFHTRYMDSARKALEGLLDAVSPGGPGSKHSNVAFVSTVTGTAIDHAELSSAGYWGKQVCCWISVMIVLCCLDSFAG
jgi:acyl transferase domain-containing protein